MADALAGLYVHVPFCQTKCGYCDFYSVTETALVDSWIDGVLGEVRRHAPAFGTFDTIYLGGGTPSVLDASDVTRLLEGVRREISSSDDLEITIEVNPDDVTAGAVEVWRELGIDRVSVGAQSFDDSVLTVLGRRHSAADTRRALELLHAGKMRNLSVDLIYGVYGQSVKSWLACVEAALAFEPDHLSCYQLTIEPRTELGRRCARGAFRALDEEEERTFFLRTSDAIRSRDYLHYEISNFARSSSKRSRHNLKYWCHAPYLGVGPAAHSYRDRRRWWNVRSVSDYVRRMRENGSAVDERETLTPKQIRLEMLFLGLRTANGVSCDFVERLPNGARVAEELVREGVVRRRARRLVPTLEGFLIADALPLRFEL